MTSSWTCPNCDPKVPTYVHDTQIYQTMADRVGGGYESDGTWDLNPDTDDDAEQNIPSGVESESESEEEAAIVVRRKPKAAAVGAGEVRAAVGLSFSDVSRKFAAIIKSAHIPM